MAVIDVDDAGDQLVVIFLTGNHHEIIVAVFKCVKSISFFPTDLSGKVVHGEQAAPLAGGVEGLIIIGRTGDHDLGDILSAQIHGLGCGSIFCQGECHTRSLGLQSAVLAVHVIGPAGYRTGQVGIAVLIRKGNQTGFLIDFGAVRSECVKVAVRHFGGVAGIVLLLGVLACVLGVFRIGDLFHADICNQERAFLIRRGIVSGSGAV